MVTLATQTLQLITHAIEHDQGAAFRQALEKVIPKMEDAYRGQEDAFRTHLGASTIGGPCCRELFLNFRWAQKSFFPDRIVRLFNRGHLEEARFIAMLQITGIDIWYETENGGQFKISDHGGHFGSSLDSVVRGLPEIEDNSPAYGEFKTHGDKSFKKLVKSGMLRAKPEHYSQMQVCMKKMDLQYGLYLAVNKNDDDLYGEIITLDNQEADDKLVRAKNIIFTDEPPQRISDTPSWYECKFCDKSNICHGNDYIEINCRTCTHVTAQCDGSWLCEFNRKTLSKADQMAGCHAHVYNYHLLNNAEGIGGNMVENWVELELEDGTSIKHGPDHITSSEIWDYL